jgi:lysozyme family protein
MRENRDKVMSWVFDDEGSYVVRSDLGQSNMGIELHTLYTYRKKHGLPIPVYQDLKNLSKEEASAIYAEQFINPCHFDDLKSGVDYVVLDTCINLGLTGGCRLIQGIYNLPVTGKWDQATLDALNKADPFRAIECIRNAWLDLKRQSPLYDQRGPGWNNRDKRVRERAKQLVGAQ